MIKKTAQTLQSAIAPILSPIEKFMQLEAAAGISLFLGMTVALIWANSPWRHSYHDFVHFPIGFYLGDFRMEHDLHFWVNDALMAIFFFLVSLEIKREILVGELSTRKKAALPMISAFGGMLVPALIYFFFNQADATAAEGWGIPTATDIAFSVGVLTLLGPRVPFALKAFLLTLAVADDLGGIIIIAFVYTKKLHWWALFSAMIFFVSSLILRESNVRNVWAYIMVGIGAWFSLLFSGVHATISGVVLAFMTPLKPLIRPREAVRLMLDLSTALEHSLKENPQVIDEKDRKILHEIHKLSLESESPLVRFGYKLHHVVNFLILPLFALLNTGIAISDTHWTDLIQHPVFLGVALGLMLGKPIGITVATYLAVKSGLGELPTGVNLRQIIGVGFIAGIGFTVATFVSHLALGGLPQFEVFSKMGILTASTASAFLGSLILAKK